ncbi:MAG TPA: hypothetical protein VGG85_10675 [Terracidiphilus sp.]|jgi:hypothetical protein
MEKPIDEDRSRDDQQPEHLVASIKPALFRTPGFLGRLIYVRLDAGLNHKCVRGAIRSFVTGSMEV